MLVCEAVMQVSLELARFSFIHITFPCFSFSVPSWRQTLYYCSSYFIRLPSSGIEKLELHFKSGWPEFKYLCSVVVCKFSKNFISEPVFLAFKSPSSQTMSEASLLQCLAGSDSTSLLTGIYISLLEVNLRNY